MSKKRIIEEEALAADLNADPSIVLNAEEVAHLDKKQKIEQIEIPQEDRVLSVIKARRLDSLSRLLQGTSKCAAACFNGEKFLITSNELFVGTKITQGENKNQDLILEVMNYLSKVANGEENIEKARGKVLKKAAFLYIGGIIENHQLEKETNNLVDYSINNDVELTNLSIRALAKHAGIEKNNQAHGNFLGNAPIAIERLKKDLENIEKDIKEIRNQKDEERSETDQNFLKAFSVSNRHLDVRRSHEPEVKMIKVDDNDKEGKAYTGRVRDAEMKPLDKNHDYGFELLHINGFGTGHVHAEMQVAQRLIDKQKIEEDNIISKDIYIGISMLCCLNCHAAIEAINLINEGKSKEHYKLSNEKDNRSRIYESPIKIHSLFLAEQEEGPVNLNVESFFVIAHRGDHDQSFTKGWNRPPFIGKVVRGAKTSGNKYNEFYENILDIITKQDHKAIMYMSDSSEEEMYIKRKVGKQAKDQNNLSVSVIEEHLSKIDNYEALNKVQELLNKAQQQLNKQSEEQKKQFSVIKIEDSALSKYDDLKYWYTDKDINDIGQQLIKELSKKE